MEFKYGAELGKYTNCPPKNAKQLARPAFRFVHESIEDKRNFLPVIVLNPMRPDIPEYKMCDAYALSMFISKETAEKKFAMLKKGNKNIHKKIGSHLATGQLTDKDGVSTEPNGEGHFSLYEFKSVTWEERFTIVGDLCGKG
jgi:hypothetical protein